MFDKTLVPQELLQEAERIQHELKYHNPQLSINLPLLPIYLGEIFPLNPVNRVLPNLNIIKILNHV